MRALTLVGDRKIDLVSLPRRLPAPGPGDAQVRVRALGLNHPDLWGYRGVAFFKRLAAGVEAAGEVAAAGDDVTSVLPGDPVVVYGAPTCATRKACRDGCDKNVGGIMGFHVDGFAPDVITMPGRLIIKAPAGIAMRDLITTVGDDPKADKARALGAEHAINDRTGRFEQMVRKIAGNKIAGNKIAGNEIAGNKLTGNKITGNKITGKKGIDVVFEHTGADTLPGSLLPLKRRDRLAACGAASAPTVTFNLMQLF
jgi:alcohol dehydrogenase